MGGRRSRRGLALLAALCVLAAHSLAAEAAARPEPRPGAEAGRLSAEYPGFDIRYGIPPGTDLAALVERPALIGMEVVQFKDPASGEPRLNGFGEAHGVFRAPAAGIAAVLDDHLGQKAFSPRLLEVRIEGRDGNRTLVYQDIGIVFLGFKIGYRVRSEVLRDELPGGAIGFRARVLECLDGGLFESFTSWYLEEVVVGGERMTYVRTYSRPGIRKPFPGMAGIIKSFTPGELKTSLEVMAREGRKRLAAK